MSLNYRVVSKLHCFILITPMIDSMHRRKNDIEIKEREIIIIIIITNNEILIFRKILVGGIEKT